MKFLMAAKPKQNVLNCFLIAAFFWCNNTSFSQTGSINGTMEVGVARVDITPQTPVRLAGYGNRKKTESEGIINRLEAKALAFASNSQRPSIFITVDLIGIPGHITEKLAKQLSEKIPIDRAQLVICASHTHGGPEVGNLLNILQYRGYEFSDSLLPLGHLIHITQYIDYLFKRLEEVALAALKDRKPAIVSWGQGQAGFASNRRTPGGPTDPSLPLLKVASPNGELRAILVNYACHGTTLEGTVNEIHGDWISAAEGFIEAGHPGAIAMVAIGCGGDANPEPRGKMEHLQLHGKEISDNVDKLLTAQLQPLTVPPVGRIKWIKLPFASVPTSQELVKQSEDKTIKGYYARLALDRIARGEPIPAALSYPVQTWTFGDDLVMINLAGEVVVDYSVRLKNELGAEKLWINAYANDVPCYMASRRIIREGGYEAEQSMYYYDKPSPLHEDVEDRIVSAVHELLPKEFKIKRDTVNHPELVKPARDGSLNLTAATATAIGPNIKYMPEWKAFGWFNAEDRSEWKVQVEKNGKYDVYLDWSVSDSEAGKPFVFEAGNRKLKGKIGKTGSWFTYRKERIGTISLTKGVKKMVFKSNPNSAKGAVLDLRQVVLVPR
jgi:neutral ceramidase